MMTKRMMGLAALLVAFAWTTPALEAQVTPVQDLDPGHPMAARARQVAEVLLAGDAAVALRHLADVTLEAARGDAFDRQVREMVEALAAGQRGYQIRNISPGPGGAMVLLAPTQSGPAIGLLVQMQSGEPYHVSGFRRIPVQLREPGR